MTTFQAPNIPGLSALKTATHRRVFLGDEGAVGYLPSSRVIDGSKARDPLNTGSVDILRAGLVLGKITSSSKFAPSIYGVTTGAILSTATTVNVSAATATEIVRRLGASSGSVKITGPATASGTARTLTLTVSGINTSTGDLTITAPGTNQVDHVRWAPAATGGNVQFRVQKADGTFVTTGNIAWSATDATFLSNANTALDAAIGVAGAVVATAIAATDTDLGMALTYSGTGYAGKTFVTATAALLGTSSTWSNSYTVTAAVDGAFVAGSFIQPVDGSETPLTFIPDSTGIKVTDEDGVSADTALPLVPVTGAVQSSQIVNWPSDTGLRSWLVAQLNSTPGAKFVFDHLF